MIYLEKKAIALGENTKADKANEIGSPIEYSATRYYAEGIFTKKKMTTCFAFFTVSTRSKLKHFIKLDELINKKTIKIVQI